MQPRFRHHRARCFRMRRVDLRRCVRTVGHHRPARKACAKPGGTPAFSKAAGRKSHTKPAFAKKPAPRPTDPSDTGKRFVPPKKPRR